MRKPGNYKGVTYRTTSHRNNYEDFVNALENPWLVKFRHNGTTIKTSAPTERQAAILYDKLCIKNGLDPVNILKPTKK